jgi:hypothetical protein
VKERYLDYHTVQCLQDVRDQYEKFGEYLYLKIGNEAIFVPAIDRNVPSHYLRTEFSAAFRCREKADWHTIDDFKSFETNYLMLSDILKEASTHDLH